MLAGWRIGVTHANSKVFDAGSGVKYLIDPYHVSLNAGTALQIESGLEATVEVTGSFVERWSVYVRCLGCGELGRLRQAMSLFAVRHQPTSARASLVLAMRMSVPLGIFVGISVALVFLPIYIASGFVTLIPIGCLVLAAQMWISSALHEFAHASVALRHQRAPVYIERRVLTLSVLVSDVGGVWGGLYAVSGPAVGAISCVPAIALLGESGLVLIPAAVAVVHLANLTPAAPDGRYLRQSIRRNRAISGEMIITVQCSYASDSKREGLAKIVLGR